MQDNDTQHHSQPEKAAAMDDEIRQISLFHTMTLLRIILSALLLLFESLGAIFGFHSNASLYILAIVNLLPWILEPFFAPHISPSSPVMPYLRKRYSYSVLRLATYRTTFAFTCCLLLLWQFHIGEQAFPWPLLSYFPLYLLLLSLVFRLAAPAQIARRIRHQLLPEI